MLLVYNVISSHFKNTYRMLNSLAFLLRAYKLELRHHVIRKVIRGINPNFSITYPNLKLVHEHIKYTYHPCWDACGQRSLISSCETTAGTSNHQHPQRPHPQKLVLHLAIEDVTFTNKQCLHLTCALSIDKRLTLSKCTAEWSCDGGHFTYWFTRSLML